MLCFNVGLTPESMPELCGDHSILGGASIPASFGLAASGHVVANGSADISAQAVVIGLGTHSYHGGAAIIVAETEVSGEGLRQGSDGAIPINFQKDFY